MQLILPPFSIVMGIFLPVTLACFFEDRGKHPSDVNFPIKLKGYPSHDNLFPGISF